MESSQQQQAKSADANSTAPGSESNDTTTVQSQADTNAATRPDEGQGNSVQEDDSQSEYNDCIDTWYGCDADVCQCRCHDLNQNRAHEPERFQDFYVVHNKFGQIPKNPKKFYIFNEHGQKIFFRFFRDGGWEDEYGNYYDANGQPVYSDYSYYDGASESNRSRSSRATDKQAPPSDSGAQGKKEETKGDAEEVKREEVEENRSKNDEKGRAQNKQQDPENAQKDKFDNDYDDNYDDDDDDGDYDDDDDGDEEVYVRRDVIGDQGDGGNEKEPDTRDQDDEDDEDEQDDEDDEDDEDYDDDNSYFDSQSYESQSDVSFFEVGRCYHCKHYSTVIKPEQASQSPAPNANVERVPVTPPQIDGYVIVTPELLEKYRKIKDCHIFQEILMLKPSLIITQEAALDQLASQKFVRQCLDTKKDISLNRVNIKDGQSAIVIKKEKEMLQSNFYLLLKQLYEYSQQPADIGGDPEVIVYTKLLQQQEQQKQE